MRSRWSVAGVMIGAVLAVGAPAAAGRIVGEWDPGIAEAELGGALVVDGYGINGLGAYAVALDDGSTVLAVCVQADVGHSLAAEYVAEAPATITAELDYLAWRYLAAGPATDDEAAAVNLLAWRESGATRRTGGTVWQGDDVEVRVLGVGRLLAVEEAVAALAAEATARRGPWALDGLTFAAGAVSVEVRGPGGPIGGVAVTFTADTGATTSAVTGTDGRATADLPGAVASVTAAVETPGPTVALAAPGSQRLVTAGPPVVVTTGLVVPTTTSTTTTSTTTTRRPRRRPRPRPPWRRRPRRRRRLRRRRRRWRRRTPPPRPPRRRHRPRPHRRRPCPPRRRPRRRPSRSPARRPVRSPGWAARRSPPAPGCCC